MDELEYVEAVTGTKVTKVRVLAEYKPDESFLEEVEDE